MRYLWTIVAAVVISVYGTTAWAAQPVQVREPEKVPIGKTLTLADCISLALTNQASVRQAAAQVQAQAGQVQQSQSALLPGTSVSSTTPLKGSTGVTDRGTNVNLGVDQLVYDFGRTGSEFNRSKHLESASKQSLTGTRADVVFNVKDAYYTMLRSGHLVDVFAQNLTAQNEHVAEAQARLTAGLAPRSDLLKAQAAAASAKVNLVNAQNTANQARITLNQTMGINILSPTQITDMQEPETPVPDEAQAVLLAMQRRPEIRRDVEEVRAVADTIRVAQTGNLPSVVTSYGRSMNIGGQFAGQDTWEWALSLQWTPFDFGNTAGAIRTAKAQLTTAQETLYNDKQNMATEVAQSRLNLLAAGEALVGAVAEVASAQEDLAASRGRYEAGVGIILDVLDAQSALLKAQVDELVARYGLSIARANLEHATGGAVVVEGRP